MQDYRGTKEAREVMGKYADILHAKRPVSEESLLKHPRMTLANRAKIFSPFAALRGYETRIAQEGRKLWRVEKQTLSEEETQALCAELAQVKRGMEVRLVYFDGEESESETALGVYRELIGRVEWIEPVGQVIRLNGRVISFGDIREITGEEIAHT